MQLEFFEVPSPCVGVCQSDEKGYCLGCMRTRDERQDWITLDSDNKQKVIKRCMQRKKRKENKQKSQVVEEIVNELNDNLMQPSLLEPSKKTTITNDQKLDFGDFEL